MPVLSISDTPFQVQFSFDQLIGDMEKKVLDQDSEEGMQLMSDLEELKSIPQLRTDITDISLINEHKDLVARLLKDYFPPALTSNEIKAVTLPYSGIIFNHTKRFADIIKAAGPQFTFNIRDFDDHQFYVLSCCLILNDLYGTSLDFSKPLFYDIPMANGVIKHYRILYNADFLDILTTEKSIKLTRDDIDELIDNYHDIRLWKSKFPVESYILKGFAIMTLVDVTIENAVSLFKEKLLTLYAADFQDNVENIFRSIYRNPDIRVGFAIFNENEGMFTIEGLGYKIHSFLLHGVEKKLAKNALCGNSYHSLIENQKYFSISDTITFQKQSPESPLAAQLGNQEIRSIILAPVVKNGHLFGVLEVASTHPQELNSINANKLDVIMPFLTDTIERLTAQFQNRVQAIIQNNYTSLHPSVYWKFRDAARQAIHYDSL
ncbi:MAG TPA: hypothetical protein VK625_20915, partial [Flavitalea sp.]|nr:hypothetical protein [Flavitalea sp.]